jgi:hypothetical protein
MVESQRVIRLRPKRRKKRKGSTLHRGFFHPLTKEGNVLAKRGIGIALGNPVKQQVHDPVKEDRKRKRNCKSPCLVTIDVISKITKTK